MRQVTRQLRDARLAQDEREREGGAALDGARRELASLGQALEERTAAAARLEGDARTALERWEGAERESARLRERICEVELGAGEWCASVGERLAGMEGWCGEMERAMCEAWGECAQVREAELVFVLHVFRSHGLDVGGYLHFVQLARRLGEAEGERRRLEEERGDGLWSGSAGLLVVLY